MTGRVAAVNYRGVGIGPTLPATSRPFAETVPSSGGIIDLLVGHLNTLAEHCRATRA
jgi:hypothetical protein